MRSERATCVGLIPARSGSKRVPGKNLRDLAGHPLLAYTISAALDSGVLDAVIGSTDDEATADALRHYGAEVPFLRPAEYAADRSPDIEWVEYTVSRLEAEGRVWDAFSILRPTSPFRQPSTIRRAWKSFLDNPGADSLRAVEPCLQHPGKMWILEGSRLRPLLSGGPEDTPWHSRATQELPSVYAQNASLEIAWCKTVSELGSIAGREIVAFLTKGVEGFDINSPYDWVVAEHLAGDAALLPRIDRPPWRGSASPRVRAPGGDA